MSALTKVFVVLHVIVSLLLVAGMVVFVNKAEDWGATARNATQKLTVEQAAHAAISTKLLEVQAEAAKASNEATNRSNVLVAANQALQAKIIDEQTKSLALTNDKEQLATQLTTAGNALKVSQDANLALDKVNTDVRNTNEDLEKKYTQSQVALSDLNNRLDAANQEVRYDKEQIAALNTELARAREQIAAMPVAPRGAAPAAPGAPGTPARPAPGGPSGTGTVPPTNLAIRGVVKSRFQVGPVDYATVGLGSADGVTKGTRFNVVDPSGSQFLGYLTVDTVEPNEASGHLSGPKVPSIQRGSTVMTNWQ